MRTLLCGVVLWAFVAAPAGAETRYDRTLEKAVMDIVAGKIGDIRGGFSYKQKPQFVVVRDAASTASIPVERPRKEASGGSNGLAPAIERPVSRTIF